MGITLARKSSVSGHREVRKDFLMVAQEDNRIHPMADVTRVRVPMVSTTLARPSFAWEMVKVDHLESFKIKV